MIEGNKKEVRSIYSKMNRLERRKTPLEKSDFGITWLGCLVTILGADWKEVYCRGSWNGLDFDGNIVRFNTETANEPMNEVFKLIKSIYPSLKIYYSAEEEGNCIFVTNDEEGKYFTDRYRVETDWGIEYYATIDGVCNHVSNCIKKVVRDEKELKTAIEDWNDNVDDMDARIYLNEFKVVKDEHL